MLNISIITATLNAESTICDCLKSVHNQTDVTTQHIIVDGNSTDGTMQLLADYSSYLDGIVSETDQGIYYAMNKGLEISEGDVVGILNADDFYGDSLVLERVAKTFETGNVDCCYGDLVYVNEFSPELIVRYWKSGHFDRRRFYWGWMPPHPTFFVRKEVYEKYGGFKPHFESAADYELMLRFLVKHEISAAYIPEVLVKMRKGGVSNRSLLNRLRANRYDRLAWKENGLHPYPWTTTLKPLRKMKQWFQKPPARKIPRC